MQQVPIEGISNPQVQGQGSVWQGIFTSGVIPEEYLKRGMDNLGAAAFITRGRTKFLSMLHTRAGSPIKVSTREPRTHQIDELDRVLTITVPSTSNDNHRSFGVPNAHAAQLQPNDVLYIMGLYQTVDSATLQPQWHNVFGLQSGLFYTNYEQVLVVAVENNDSAGTGNTRVYVRRLYTARGAGDFQGGVINIPSVLPEEAAITTEYSLLRGLPSFPEGGDAPRGFSKNSVLDNNFTQEFKYAVEATKESEIEKTWLGKTPMEVYKMLKVRQMTLDIERTFLFGRKSKSIDSTGKVQYTTGGVVEFILQDTDHIFPYTETTLSYPGMLDMVDKITRNGGSTEREMYVGLKLYNEMKKAFFSSGYLRYDEKASREFDIPIESIIGAGLKLNIVPLHTLSECGWDNRALIVDNMSRAFVPVTHEGWDMREESDIQAKGQMIKKDQWVGIKGLQRRYAQYQHIVYFPNL